MRTKVPRSSYLVQESGEDEEIIQNVTRYYVAKTSNTLWKWMPPLKKNPDKWRKFAIQSGWCVQVCNDIHTFDATLIDHDYYIREIEKLVLGVI